ncbi:MAG: rod shape-determining protein MreD [Acidobacteriota bacterium]
MKAAAALGAIAVALALQTTLASLVIPGTAALDFVLIVVVYLALVAGPATGLLLGTAAGLVQDALSSGVVGIGGLAKTVVGYVAGVLGTQFIVTAPVSRFIVFVVASLLHAAIFMGLYTLLDLRHFDAPLASVFGQAAGNGFLGVVGAQLGDVLPGAWERRRSRRKPER